MMNITIYQINKDKDDKRLSFCSLDLYKDITGSDKVDLSIYDNVFSGKVACEDLEDVYMMFNINHPEGFKGHSLSVSDIILTSDGKYNYVDSFGFSEVSIL